VWRGHGTIHERPRKSLKNPKTGYTYLN